MTPEQTESPVEAENQLGAEIAAAIPDDIDIFRLLRRAGRSDSAKAKAINAALTPIRNGVALLASRPPRTRIPAV